VDPNHTTAKKLLLFFPLFGPYSRTPFSKGGRWWPYYYRGRGGGGEGRDRFYLSLDHLGTIMGALSLGIFGLYIFPIF
jgi:hypothetical protein